MPVDHHHIGGTVVAVRRKSIAVHVPESLAIGPVSAGIGSSGTDTVSQIKALRRTRYLACLIVIRDAVAIVVISGVSQY